MALQLGHRQSIDLDFFISTFPKAATLLQSLSAFCPQVLSESAGTLDLGIDSVKVSFLEYKYPLLEPLIPYGESKMASVLDIACMKISAVSSRGSKKDFVDLWFILKKYSLADILHSFEEKYKDVKYNKLHIIKSLLYFTDAEADPEPDYLAAIDWSEVKNTFEKQVKDAIGKW